MTSLRTRLMWGIALVAVVPLALAMIVLSRQIRATIERDAARRLEVEMAGLESQFADDAARMVARLRILGNEAPLKRLFLLRSADSRELSDYLAGRRFLLGLDVLAVADPGGALRAADSIEAIGLTLRSRAPIPYQGENAGWVVGGLRLSPAFLARWTGSSGVELALADESGHAAASTLDSAGAAAALATEGAAGPGTRRVRLAEGSYLARGIPLELGDGHTARLVGLVSTSTADAMTRALQVTSLLLAMIGLAVAVVLGMVWSSQISRPVEQIAAFSSRLAAGQWDDPLIVNGVREVGTLVDALERMRDDLRQYRSRLVTSERQAAWGQMARQVAHEIKNPLTPIAISVDDLRRSFQQQRPDFPAILEQATRTIASEIEALKRLLQEFSEFGRMAPPRLARVPVREWLGTIAALYQHDVAQGRLVVRPLRGEPAVTADPDQLRQALVNLIKNGLEAIGPGGHVEVAATADDVALEITVTDDGPGLSPEQLEHRFAPGFSTKPGGSGLGLTIVERIVSDHGGTVGAEAGSGGGTCFRLRIPLEPRS